MRALSDVRREIDEVDIELSGAVVRRMRLVREVAEIKRESGSSVRDLSREEEVVRMFEERFALLGVGMGFGGKLARFLIESAVAEEIIVKEGRGFGTSI